MIEAKDSGGVPRLIETSIFPALFELFPMGIVLIDDHLRLCAANLAGATMLRKGTGLRVATGGYLSAEVPTLRADFSAFLRRL